MQEIPREASARSRTYNRYWSGRENMIPATECTIGAGVAPARHRPAGVARLARSGGGQPPHHRLPRERRLSTAGALHRSAQADLPWGRCDLTHGRGASYQHLELLDSQGLDAIGPA